jgi:hypothetical protein
MMTAWLMIHLLMQPAASSAAPPALTSALSRMEAIRPAGPAEIASLNQAMDSDLASARRAGRLTPGQRDAFSRASAYLSEAGSPANPAMRVPMAQAWRRVGEGMELGGSNWDRSAALAGYRNSFIWLGQYPGQNLADPSIQGELYFVAGRVRALGGTIPIWASAPLGGAQPRQQRGIPEEYLQPAERVEPPPMVEIPRAGLAPEERAKVDALEQRFNGATVSVMAARGSVDSLRRSLEAQRLELHPEISRRYEAMLASHDRARAALDGRQWSLAEEQIDIASGYARKLLAEMGR